MVNPTALPAAKPAAAPEVASPVQKPGEFQSTMDQALGKGGVSQENPKGSMSVQPRVDAPEAQTPQQDTDEQIQVMAPLLLGYAALWPAAAIQPAPEQEQPSQTTLDAFSNLVQGSAGVEPAMAQNMADTQSAFPVTSQAAELSRQVVDILEGFVNLQDGDYAPTFVDALAAKIEQAGQGEAAVEDVMAWMPQNMPLGIAMPEEANQPIEQWLMTHLCSLENTNGMQISDAATAMPVHNAAQAEDAGNALIGKEDQGDDPVPNTVSRAELSGVAYSAVSGSLAAQAAPVETAAIAQDLPVTADRLFTQIVEQTHVSLKDDRQSIEIQLRPEFLGRVSIQLSLEGERVSAVIRASSQQVQGLLASELSQLQQALQSRGIEVVDLHVGSQTADQQMTGSMQQQDRPMQGDSQQARGRSKTVGRVEPPANRYEQIFLSAQPPEADKGVEYRA